MARSAQYWLDIMLTEKSTMANLSVYQPSIYTGQTLLSDLKSTSKVRRWVLLFWCVACCAAAMDVVQSVAIAIMESIAARSRYGTLPWWVDVAKAFQYGDTLILDNLEWKYATENDAAKIIKFSAAQEADGQVNIKIATLSGDDTVPVGAPQLAAFTTYCNKKKPAGIRVNIINEVADEVKLFIDVRFDPLLLSATGELISSPGTYPVDDAINLYRKKFGFNGNFELMNLINTIEKATGVVTAYVTSAQGRYGANPFTAFTKRYQPNSGHVIIHGDSLTTYTADV